MSFSAVTSRILTVQFVLQKAAKRLNCGRRSFFGSVVILVTVVEAADCEICFSKGLADIFANSILHQT